MTAEPRSRASAIRRALTFVLVLNALVVIVKIVVGVRTGALTVLGAALESSLDVLNNLIGMALVTVASRGPDDEHPYGHDKFETLGALAIVGFLSISCFELLREGVAKLLNQQPPDNVTNMDVGFLLLTAIVNLFVVRYERNKGRELHSGFLLADAAHTRGDIYVTTLALISLGLTRIGLGVLDPVLGLVVALMIARSGYQVLKDSIPVLVDQRAVEAAKLRSLIESIPEVVDIRQIRSRSTASGLLFAEVTIGVPAQTSVAEAHAVADKVEARIGEQLGASEVTVHVEPA
jgi:cation diffusion facilitator family transporter